jgi:hypothetical protein
MNMVSHTHRQLNRFIFLFLGTMVAVIVVVIEHKPTLISRSGETI